jgi:AraC-like DNA-binding protein
VTCSIQLPLADRLAEHLDAANAAFQVGYESPSQFSREYNRLFGAPPLRDIANLRQISTGE